MPSLPPKLKVLKYDSIEQLITHWYLGEKAISIVEFSLDLEEIVIGAYLVSLEPKFYLE